MSLSLTKFEVDETYAFMGHSHYPFIKRVKDTTFVNVGSCGLPRDDGRYGSFALLDTTDRHVSIFRFDISKMTKNFLQELEFEIHDMVLSLFNRKSNNMFGYLLSNCQAKGSYD